MVIATPKPRLVKLLMSTVGEETFSTGTSARTATHYLVKIKVGGVTGIFASVLGKQPPDWNVWMLRGPAPAFVKSEQPLFAGGPIWRIELVSPAWSDPSQPAADK
jgi:hypothetical protein